MIKRVSLAHKRRDLSTEDFVRHWLGPHADIARRIPGLRGYVVLVADDPEGAGCDGVAITWFDNREAAEAGFNTEPLRSELAADRPKFLEGVQVFFTEQHVVVAPPANDPSFKE